MSDDYMDPHELEEFLTRLEDGGHDLAARVVLINQTFRIQQALEEKTRSKWDEFREQLEQIELDQDFVDEWNSFELPEDFWEDDDAES